MTRIRGGSGAPYDVLGYRCTSKASRDTLPIRGDSSGRGPHCRTAFYINVKTGRLETFFTTDPSYSEGHGVRIGMASATAERLLRKRRSVGCETDIYLYGRHATLTVAFVGGRQQNSHVVGGHVFAFVLHNAGADAGVFDCL
jgi:hypothetical protein